MSTIADVQAASLDLAAVRGKVEDLRGKLRKWEARQLESESALAASITNLTSGEIAKLPVVSVA